MINIPPSASAIRLSLMDAEADLDIFLRSDYIYLHEEFDELEPNEIFYDADFYSDTNEWNEELTVYKVNTEVLFPPGQYFLDIVHQYSPWTHDYPEEEISINYKIMYELFDSQDITRQVQFGQVIDLELNEGNTYLAHFSIPGQEPFRIDILDTAGKVDLFLSRYNPSPQSHGLNMVNESVVSRKSLLVEPEDDEMYYLTLIEQFERQSPVPVKLVFTRGLDGPPSAPKVLQFPDTLSPNDKILHATVQLHAGDYTGSGSLVSSDGLIITNHHVVVDEQSDEYFPSLIVAVSFDPYQPPQEMFLAEVIDSRKDSDLAIIRIISDLWGRDLPEDYRFPYWEIGNSERLDIGDSLFFMGYPSVGSNSFRDYYTLTKGILAGGEMTADGLILKSDGIVSPGSSGGAVSDSEWSLVGVPSFTMSDETAQLTFFVPVSRFPREWVEMFGELD